VIQFRTIKSIRRLLPKNLHKGLNFVNIGVLLPITSIVIYHWASRAIWCKARLPQMVAVANNPLLFCSHSTVACTLLLRRWKIHPPSSSLLLCQKRDSCTWPSAAEAMLRRNIHKLSTARGWALVSRPYSSQTHTRISSPIQQRKQRGERQAGCYIKDGAYHELIESREDPLSRREDPRSPHTSSAWDIWPKQRNRGIYI
jgi:hypothetical protein